MEDVSGYRKTSCRTPTETALLMVSIPFAIGAGAALWYGRLLLVGALWLDGALFLAVYAMMKYRREVEGLKKAAFVSHTDLEVGDVVQTTDPTLRDLYEVWDVLTIHSYKNGTVDFMFMIATDGGVIGRTFGRGELKRIK